MLIETQDIDKACRDMMRRAGRLRQFAIEAERNQDQNSANQYEHEALGVDWCVTQLERAMTRKPIKKAGPARLVSIR